MNKRLSQAGCLVASMLCMSAPQAFNQGSMAGTCFVRGSTHMCSESFTSANVLDAIVFTGGSVRVHAFFRGPDYDVEKELSSEIVWLFPFTWTVTARLTPTRCAYSGVHSAEGGHSANGKREGLPFPTYGPRHTLAFLVQHYCDCEGEIF